MKIGNFTRVKESDLGDKAPSWFSAAFGPIQTLLEQLVVLSQGNVSVTDNINCEIREITLTQDEEKTISLSRVSGKPIGIRVLWQDIYDWFPNVASKMTSETEMVVKCHWSTDPGVKVTVRFEIIGK